MVRNLIFLPDIKSNIYSKINHKSGKDKFT